MCAPVRTVGRVGISCRAGQMSSCVRNYEIHSLLRKSECPRLRSQLTLPQQRTISVRSAPNQPANNASPHGARSAVVSLNTRNIALIAAATFAAIMTVTSSALSRIRDARRFQGGGAFDVSDVPSITHDISSERPTMGLCRTIPTIPGCRAKHVDECRRREIVRRQTKVLVRE
jgi:hypothetical protein